MFNAKYKASYVNEDLYKRIDEFWEWFLFERKNLEKMIDEKNRQVFPILERELLKVFRERKSMPLALGYKEEVYHFFIYYGHNSYLMTLGDELYGRMPKSLKGKWMLMIEK